jgi:surface protein
MFQNAKAFNQDISGWDVSSAWKVTKGTGFVSYGQGVIFGSMRSLVWLIFQVGCRVKSITDVWLLKEHSLNQNCVFHYSLVLVWNV